MTQASCGTDLRQENRILSIFANILPFHYAQRAYGAVLSKKLLEGLFTHDVMHVAVESITVFRG